MVLEPRGQANGQQFFSFGRLRLWGSRYGEDKHQRADKGGFSHSGTSGKSSHLRYLRATWLVAAAPGFVFLAAVLLLAQTSRPVPPAPIRFRNVAAAAGVDFVLENSPTAEKHLIETMPGGIAVFDYDGDGLPDIFFTNGASVPSLEKNAPTFHNRLFRNLSGMQFKDVTLEAGLAGAGYSVGAARADYDNDGHVDLF